MNSDRSREARGPSTSRRDAPRPLAPCRTERTMAAKSCTAPMNTAPSTIQIRPGSQP
jgi:hypothetical protein